MIPLLSIKPYYSQEELNSLWPAARLSAHFGVQKKFLYFASPDYTEVDREMYGVHKFSSFNLEGKRIAPEEQEDNALVLLDSGKLWSSSVIVINSPHTLFNGKENALGIEAFLSHILCSLAYRVQKRKAPSVEVNFLETVQLDHTKGYQMKENHLLIWGPCTENFSSYDCNKTVQFLFSFRSYAKILLVSTVDLEAFLEKFQLSLDAVSFIFNLETKPGKPEKIVTPKKKPVLKKRGRKAKSISI